MYLYNQKWIGIVTVFPLCLGLLGCAVEQNYRGVPAPTWKHLTSEQKQLIVDQAYQKEIIGGTAKQKNYVAASTNSGA